MNLAELVIVRDGVIAAHARADRAVLLLEGSRVERDARLRVELGHVDDELARVAGLLNEAIDKQRNEQGS